MTLHETIERVLLELPETRDDDFALVWQVSKRIVGPEYLGLLSYSNALALMRDGRLPTFDSITRIRRMIQEDNPATHGKLWVERKLRGALVADRARRGDDLFA